MKFAHIADCHLGGWRDERLKNIGHESFLLAMKECVERSVDFVLIAGDLFNTAVPSIDSIKVAAQGLKKVKDAGIPIYVITGSHDHSPSGKTMVDVLEEAGLLENVMKVKDGVLSLTIDPKTNVKMAGIYGRKVGLEKEDYQSIDMSAIEKEEGFKIFLFHTAIDEFKPEVLKHVECQSYEELPKGFNYYAGGHVHYILQKPINSNQSLLVYPGATYPNNFKELEEFNYGHFWIVKDGVELEDVWLKIKDVVSLEIDVDGLTPSGAENTILQKMKELDCSDKIVTVRIKGVIIEGKVSDIDLSKIDSELSLAYAVLKNTSKLVVKEEKEEMIIEEEVPEKIEQKLVLGKIDDGEKQKMASSLIEQLVLEKHEGEKNLDFENRVISTMVESLDLKELVNDEA